MEFGIFHLRLLPETCYCFIHGMLNMHGHYNERYNFWLLSQNCCSQIERRMEIVRLVSHNTHKKMVSCLQGHVGTDAEKRHVSACPFWGSFLYSLDTPHSQCDTRHIGSFLEKAASDGPLSGHGGWSESVRRGLHDCVSSPAFWSMHGSSVSFESIHI